MNRAWGLARKMAERGIAIVPVPPREKGCKLANWPELASTDSKQIDKWANAEPEGNYGVVASPETVVILDADNPGLRSQIERTTGNQFPDTFSVRSSKGYHYYFKQTDKTRAIGNRKVVEMFDLQSNRKYVVGPGSIHPSGAEYTIMNNTDIVPMPDWLTDHLEAWSDKSSKSKTASVGTTVNTGNAKGEPVLHKDFDANAFFDWYAEQDAFMIEGHRNWNGNEVCITDKCIIADRKHSGSWHTGFIVGHDKFGYHCESPDCNNPSIGDVLRKLNKMGYDRYPKRIWEERELDTSKFPLQTVDDVVENDESVDDVLTADSTSEEVRVDYMSIRMEIDGIMRMPAKSNPKTGEEGMPLREKHRQVCAKVYRHMMRHGKLYDCGNVATYLDGRTQELIQVVSGSTKFNRLMMHYGILPTDNLCDALGQFLGARATTDATKATIYTLSFYDTENHVLYVNEYGGYFLRIDGRGHVSRHRNGEFDMLFNDGSESECDPLCADITGSYLQLLCGTLRADDGNNLIEQQILDVIKYDESQLGREAAHMILMNSILCLFLYERVPSYPYVFLFGAGAAMKSALAVRVGKLIQGRRFRVRFAEDDVQQMKDLAISLPFLVLDEANNIKKLQNLLKAVGTGAMDSRRELYTTAKMRYTPYQARIWMTANTASLTNETISSRMLIVDAAPRTETEPYRSEHYLEWPDELRNQIWTELIGRLAKAMYELKQADDVGMGDLRVDHRMSSFFVLGRSLARQEGYEDKFMDAMKRMTLRQQGASIEGNDIVDLVRKLPPSYAGIFKTAAEWSGLLVGLVSERNRELASCVSRTNWVAWKFTSEFHTLTRECGMRNGYDTHRKMKTYSFDKLEGREPEVMEPHVP